MKVKLQVPASLDDITVGQSQKIQELQSNTSLTELMLEDEILKVVLRNDNVNSLITSFSKKRSSGNPSYPSGCRTLYLLHCLLTN